MQDRIASRKALVVLERVICITVSNSVWRVNADSNLFKIRIEYFGISFKFHVDRPNKFQKIEC